MRYEAVTSHIRVSVQPQFLADQSAPEDGRYVWAYTIEIANEGKSTVQLQERYWRITDARGKVEEVRGPGVVGETPVLKPGQSFKYTSGCPLQTASGIMAGNYVMVGEDGVTFTVDVPAFSLDSPFTRRALH